MKSDKDSNEVIWIIILVLLVTGVIYLLYLGAVAIFEFILENIWIILATILAAAAVAEIFERIGNLFKGFFSWSNKYINTFLYWFLGISVSVGLAVVLVAVFGSKPAEYAPNTEPAYIYTNNDYSTYTEPVQYDEPVDEGVDEPQEHQSKISFIETKEPSKLKFLEPTEPSKLEFLGSNNTDNIQLSDEQRQRLDKAKEKTKQALAEYRAKQAKESDNNSASITPITAGSGSHSITPITAGSATSAIIPLTAGSGRTQNEYISYPTASVDLPNKKVNSVSAAEHSKTETVKAEKPSKADQPTVTTKVVKQIKRINDTDVSQITVVENTDEQY